MKNLNIILLLIMLFTNAYASNLIDFNGVDGAISSNNYIANGISSIENGFILDNRLEQSNTDVPGLIKISFSTPQTIVKLDYFRDENFGQPSEENIIVNLISKSTILKAYDGANSQGNIITVDSLNSDGVIEVIGNNNILSIELSYVYDGYGGFNSFDNLYFDTELSLLPVELVSFELVTIDYNKVEITWETVTEINNYGFEIEKREVTKHNNYSDWESKGFVRGNGNSNSPKYYSFIDVSDHNSNIIQYRLKQIDVDGQYEYSHNKTIEINNNGLVYKLNQNYPNPFNPYTQINYSIPKAGNVKISIHDILGNLVSVLKDDPQTRGNYSINFNGKQLSSGLYIYSIETKDYAASKKMVILK